jgi:hypothetical protein
MLANWLSRCETGGSLERLRSGLPTSYGNCELVPVHSMRAYRGIRIIGPFIINFETNWRLVITSRSVCFTPGDVARHPLKNRRGRSG